MDTRYAAEALLKENPLSLVKVDRPSQPPPVDISINIEVSTSSPDVTGQTTTSFIPLEEEPSPPTDSLAKEKESMLESQEVGKQRTSLSVAPKPSRRQSSKPAVTQLFQLEVSPS